MKNVSDKQKWIAGFIVLMLAAFFSEGYHHPDEHYQLIEFAQYYLGEADATNLPWEFEAQMRPTAQVFIAAGFIKFFSFFGADDPFFLAWVLRIISALLSFFSIRLLVQTFSPRFQSQRAKSVLLLLSLFLWFIVYNNIRFSSENWSGTLFLMGFTVFYMDRIGELKRYLWVGALFGLSFLFRYQAIIMIGGFGLWMLFIHRANFKNSLALIGGFVGVSLVGSLGDILFYGDTVFPFYNFIDENIFQGKAAEFGTEPVWFYLKDIFEKSIPPFSLFYLFAFGFMIYKQPKSALTWSLVPFFLVHSFISHKEGRFLFPMVFFLPLILAELYEKWEASKWADWLKKKVYKIFRWLFIVVNGIALLVITFKSADSGIKVYRAIYEEVDGTALLYYMKKTPYEGGRGKQLHFYMPDDLKFQKAENLNEIKAIKGEDCLFATSDRSLFDEIEARGWENVYRSLPKWVDNVNFNNWVDRTPQWRLYRITEEE